MHRLYCGHMDLLDGFFLSVRILECGHFLEVPSSTERLHGTQRSVSFVRRLQITFRICVQRDGHLNILCDIIRMVLSPICTSERRASETCIFGLIHRTAKQMLWRTLRTIRSCKGTFKFMATS